MSEIVKSITKVSMTVSSGCSYSTQERPDKWSSTINCLLLKLTGRLGLFTQNDPRKQCLNANSFVLRVETLLSGIVLGE